MKATSSTCYLVVAIIVLTSGCNAYKSAGCDPDPSSSDLAVGESTQINIEVVDGVLGTLDVAGRYWSTEDSTPIGTPDIRTLSGTATLMSDSVSVELSSGEVVAYDGPINCS